MPHPRAATRTRSLHRAVALAVSLAAASVGRAQVSTWHDIGEIGGPALVVGGLGSSLVQDGSLGEAHAARTFDGLLVSGAATELLKFVTHERRPYGTTFDSFPSGHATAAFAIAAAQSNFHPSQAPYWYGAATVIAVARVAGHDHHIQDVIAGAVIGYLGGQLSASSRRGWIVAQAVGHNQTGPAAGFDQPTPDAFSGSVLGYAAGQLSLGSRRGWLLAPIVERNHAGLMLSFNRAL